MKLRTLAVLAGALGLLITVPSPVNAAAKQTVKVYMTGDCADGQAVEGVDEDDCELTVNVTPKASRRSAVLEVAYDPDEPEWEELDAGKTKNGRLVFDAPAVDEYMVRATDEYVQMDGGKVRKRVRGATGAEKHVPGGHAEVDGEVPV